MIDGTVKLRRRLDRIINWLSSGAATRKAGIAVLRHSGKSFDEARDPETGAPWSPMAPSTAARPRKGQLNVSGKLRRSIDLGGPGNIFRSSPMETTIGSSDPNAARAQHGTRAHVIVPRGSVLAFQGAGGMVFARRVNHPGTPVRLVLGVSREASHAIELQLMVDLDREIQKA